MYSFGLANSKVQGCNISKNLFLTFLGLKKPWKCGVILPSFSLTKNDLFIVSELLSENLLHVAPFSTNPFLSF